MEQRYELIMNYGADRGFEVFSLDRRAFLKKASGLVREPRKIFFGLGDFLEVGDYNTLLDTIFFDTEGVKFEGILDSNNRRVAMEGEIPNVFFKLAVYFPDFLLKNVPVECVSAIGEKARLFPGAEAFVSNIKQYDPTAITAMPSEIALEFIKRVGLGGENLFATEYLKKFVNKREVYAGDIKRFVSGDRKSLQIEKYMSEKGLREGDVLYMGRGEAGLTTFSSVNSVAFNPPENIMPRAKITLYGSSLESLLVLFNFDGRLDRFLLSYINEEYIPSLIVVSERPGKSDDLIKIETEHLTLQNNLIGQRIEHSGESYSTVERELDIAFTGSSININEVKKMVTERMEIYRANPGDLVRDIYDIARARYKKFCTVH